MIIKRNREGDRAPGGDLVVERRIAAGERLRQ